jgi:hypothetical protein
MVSVVARSQSRKPLLTESSWFEFQFRNGTYDFRVDETKMRRIPEFSEARDLDDSEKAPRDDRHRQKSKWLNVLPEKSVVNTKYNLPSSSKIVREIEPI